MIQFQTAVQHGKGVGGLPFLESCRGRLLAYAARREISRREQIPGRDEETHLSTHARIRSHIQTKKKVMLCTNSQRAFERRQHARGPKKHENMSHRCRWYLDDCLHNSYKVYFSAFCQIAYSPFAQLLQNESSHATTESIHPPLSAQSTCLLNLVEAHSVWIALVEAVGVTEGLQRGNWGQDVTQSDSLPQQPQSDQGTCPPQHFHGSLLTAALQAHSVHLREM